MLYKTGDLQPINLIETADLSEDVVEKKLNDMKQSLEIAKQELDQPKENTNV